MPGQRTKAVVAGINGEALGGGLEHAFCHTGSRSSAKVGLPEVLIGLPAAPARSAAATIGPKRRWNDGADVTSGEDAKKLVIIDEIGMKGFARAPPLCQGHRRKTTAAGVREDRRPSGGKTIPACSRRAQGYRGKARNQKARILHRLLDARRRSRRGSLKPAPALAELENATSEGVFRSFREREVAKIPGDPRIEASRVKSAAVSAPAPWVAVSRCARRFGIP